MTEVATTRRAMPRKHDADYVFYELTRSICPVCRRAIDAQILLQDGRVYMRKRCAEHGPFEALVYGDAEAYVSSARFNKPGTIPLEFGSRVESGCPYDCGLCPDHQQHACVGIIEVNSACNMDCPLCFANAGAGFNLGLEDVEEILDGFVAAEGDPQFVQFSGGEPTIHPELPAMLRAAKARGIPHVMVNTNGRRIAHDDAFLAEIAEIRPSFYFQFDGFEDGTYKAIRGERGLLDEKLRALDRLAAIDCDVVLVPAVERGVNLHEVGRIVEFGIAHPAVRGVNFQAAFHAGRHPDHNPLERVTIPDILRALEEQTAGTFMLSDFVPVPCCFPTCNSVTYAYVDDDGSVLPLPRVLEVEDYLDYITNRIIPDVGSELRAALEGLWSSSAMPGSEKASREFALSCAACELPAMDLSELSKRVFMVMLQDFMDPWTFNQKNVMKCCKEFLLPGGKQIPFCAYNSLGYREQARLQLAERERERARARHEGRPFQPKPITFAFESR